MSRLLAWLDENGRGLLAFGSLCAISIGCGMERLSLGLIVPAALILGLLVLSHLTGRA